MRRRTSIAYFFRAEKKKFPRTKHVRENSGYLLEKRLVVDLLALADLEAFFELLGGVGRVDGLDLLFVDHHAALLDKTASFALGGNELAGEHQIKNGDLAIGELVFRYGNRLLDRHKLLTVN